MRHLNQMKKYSPKSTNERVVNAIITAMLYCMIQKMKISVASGRFVLCRPRFKNTSNMLHELHWLPVYQRFRFKILLLTHKALHEDKFPIYQRELLQACKPLITLRSSNNKLLVEPKTDSKPGKATFVIVAEELWNDMPDILKKCDSRCKCAVKTRLLITNSSSIF